MNRIYAYLLLVLMILPFAVIPTPGVAQRVSVGVTVKAGTYNFTDISPTNKTVLITDNGVLRIIINRTEASELGDSVRLAFLLDDDVYDPNAGGFFLNVSNIGIYGPSDPTQSPYGGVVDLTKEGPLYLGTPSGPILAGNVTLFDGGKVVVIKVLLKNISLDNIAYITNVYTEEYRYENLYTTASQQKLLRAKVYDASSWDAVISNNKFKVLYVPVTCNDVIINIFTPNVAYSDTVNIQVSFQRFFEKVYEVSGISLDVRTDNYTEIKMYNRFDTGEMYTLAEYVNGVLTNMTQPAFVQSSIVITANNSAVNFSGEIDDYAPSTVAPDLDEITALYFIGAEFHHEIVNETANLSFTISCTSLNSATSTPRTLRLWATMNINEITDVFGDPTVLNPYDKLNFTTHNVPATYNRSDVSNLTIFNDRLIVRIPASSFNSLSYNINGTINGTVTLPDAPYGGEAFYVELVMNDGKYVPNSMIHVFPYFETFIVTNNTAFQPCLSNTTKYKGLFVEEDYAAPGDYLLVKGWGFNTTNSTYFVNNFEAYLDTTELWRAALSFSNVTGKVTAVFRIMNTTAYPLDPGAYVLTVGSSVTDSYSKPFTVVRNESVAKIWFNPEIKWNGTSFMILHDKVGGVYGNFTVEYPLINNTFQTVEYELHHTIEIIGQTSDWVNLTFYSLTWNMEFSFINISLVNGYAKTSLYDREITFLPYGNYTLQARIGSIATPLRSVENRTVFNVLMGVNADASQCRNGTLVVEVVGAAPNATMTLNFTYTVTETVNSISPGISPIWAGVLTVNVTTNRYGVGTTSIPLTLVYSDEYVENATLDTLIRLGIRLSEIENVGNTSLVFLYEASLDTIADNLSTGIMYELGPSDTSFSFETYVLALYNFTLTINTSTILSPVQFVINVPDVVLPGDNITVQIFPHHTPVWDLVVVGNSLFDVSEGDKSKVVWYLDVRLVDPVTNSIVSRVRGYYAGKIIFDDVDGDDLYEFWFVANLRAPFILGTDKSYRVDTVLSFAVATSNTTHINMSISTSDGGCHNNVTVNGTIYFTGYGTNLLIGSDKQTVEVLGVLEGKLDWIKNGIVEINATVNEINTYLKVNVTELLNAINNTVVQVKNDTAILIIGQAEIKSDLATLLNLTTQVNDTVTMILACCGNINSKLDRIESTLNETYEYVLWINGNVSTILETLNNVVIPKFTELYNNITVEINASRDAVIYEIREVNDTLVNYALLVDSHVVNVSNILVSQIIPMMNWYYGNLTMKIEDVNATIIGELYEVNESLTLKINAAFTALNDTLTTVLDKLEEYYMELEDKINGAYNNLTMKIDESTMYIVDNITAANRSIILFVNGSTNRLCNRLSMIQNLIETRFNDTFNLIRNVNASLSMQISDAKIELLTKLNNVNSTLTTTIITQANMTRELVASLISNLNTTILSRLDDMEGTLILYMTAYEQRLEGLIEEKADDIVYNLSVLIDSDYNALKDLINVKADMLSFEINNATTVILATIGDVNLTIYNELKEVEADISSSTAEIKTAIGSVNVTMKKFYEALEDLIKNKATTLNASLSQLILRVNDTLTLTINGKAGDIESLINTLSNDLSKDVAKLLGEIDTVGKSVNDTLKAQINSALNSIIGKIDDQTNTLQNALSSSTKTLSDKIDALSKTVKDTSDKINGNISIFGSATLLLVVIIIGLVGYSLISQRRVG